MKKIIKPLLCIGLLSNLGIAPVRGEETSAPYVLTQSINNIPVEKSRCLELLRTYMPSEGEESDIVQQISAEIEKLNQAITDITAAFNELNSTIEHLAQLQQQANEQHTVAIEVAYESYRQSDEDFDNRSEEEQLILLSEDVQVKEWQLALDDIQQQLNEQIVQRDKLEKQHQERLYELDVQTNLLEKQRAERSQLNQCLLYPYSVQREGINQLLINTQTRELNDLLINLDTYLQRFVPAAYRKVSFNDIAQLFSLTRTATEVAEQLYGKPPIQLDERGKEYYTYAQELNLRDIEILANLALRDYFNSGDLAQLYARYEEVLTIKEGQYAYFYAINQEAFAQIKQLLTDYLNAHQLWNSLTIEQLQTFHERYQMKLVLFDESAQQWYVAPDETSGFYQMFATYNLEGQTSSGLSHSSINSSAQTDVTSTEVQPRSTGKLDSLKNKLKRKPMAQSNSTKSLPKSERHQSADEREQAESSSSPQAKPKLQTQPKQARKQASASSKDVSASLPTAESRAETGKNTKQEGISLPSTGEQEFILWVAIGMLTIGIGILVWDIYLRYKKRKALEKIKLD
ncbi:LPXTG cell wall anchor domain-containing protein [Aerococcaceae bacterium NML191219]|nr:LPXTG cell wall anchor domain-containing protein [Aerococcaceae bacterium NML191219]